MMKFDRTTPDQRYDYPRPHPLWVSRMKRAADRFVTGTLCLVALLVVLNLYRLAAVQS